MSFVITKLITYFNMNYCFVDCQLYFDLVRDSIYNKTVKYEDQSIIAPI